MSEGYTFSFYEKEDNVSLYEHEKYVPLFEKEKNASLFVEDKSTLSSDKELVVSSNVQNESALSNKEFLESLLDNELTSPNTFWEYAIREQPTDMRRIKTNGTEASRTVPKDNTSSSNSSSSSVSNNQDQRESQYGDLDEFVGNIDDSNSCLLNLSTINDEEKKEEVKSAGETLNNLGTFDAKVKKTPSTLGLNKSGSQTKKRGRKPLNEEFHGNKYSNLRAVLRKMKKYYKDRFNETNDYKKQKKIYGVKDYKNNLKKFIKEEFKETSSENFKFILGCFISPDDTKKLIADKIKSHPWEKEELVKIEELVNEMCQLLNSFSITKFKSVARYQEFLEIFSNFQNKVSPLTSNQTKTVECLLKNTKAKNKLLSL